MTVKIAIQKTQDSFKNRTSVYSKRWIVFCQEQQVKHQIVNAYEDDIISQLKRFDGFLWQFDHQNPTDLLMARHVLQSAAKMGLVVFPNVSTSWHFDDKIAQKYLLEAIDAPLIPSHVFYQKQMAVNWLKGTNFPIVAKLRRGAGSYNVRLIRSMREAESYCRKAFGRGFQCVPSYFDDFGTKARNIKNFSAFRQKMKRMPSLVLRKLLTSRAMNRERGYVFFQDFIEENTSDIRISVIGNRAWGFIRHVRKGDFRASGSGRISYEKENIPKECVRIAFRIAQSLKTQSCAFDFLRTSDGRYVIAEISYAFVSKAIYNCPGYWDENLVWHDGHYWPEDAIIEDLLVSIEKKKSNLSQE